MMGNDTFSQLLGMKVIEIKEGSCKIKLSVTKNMLNGFGIAHGGITYCLADSALAFASNSKGRKSVSIETSIAHIISLKEGEEIMAMAQCETETDKLGHYKVTVHLCNEPEKIVAIFKGMVYKTSKNWD
jgi:acyl-CoA thioesterase